MNTTNLLFDEVTAGGFAAYSPKSVDWLWHGYLARGATTLLTSQWKSGKTTLISVLLARLAGNVAGFGGQLAGLDLAKAKAAIVSEERLEHWRRRHEKLHFPDDLVFLCRPFSSRPTRESWEALVDRLARLGGEQGVELVVIDPLAQFLPPASENEATAILDALQPLAQLTAAGQSVLLVHHPRKKESAPGLAARGSGALASAVDILVEMKLPPGSVPQDRRRKLSAWSRFEETPCERIIELSPDGTDYTERQLETADDRREDYVAMVEHLLTCPARQLTRRQLLNEWPKKSPTPHPVMLWRALDIAVTSGRSEQEGTGRKGDPLRYAVPGLDATWRPDLRDLMDLP